MFNKKSDPLLGSIQKVMNENALRRQLEAKLNEDLGVTSKKAIPHEYHSDYDKALNTEIQHALSEQTKPQTIDAGITHEPPKTISTMKSAPITGSGSGGSGAQPPEGRRGGTGGSVRSGTQIINDPFQGASVNEVTKAVASSLQEKFRKIVKQKMVDAPTDAANDPSRDPDLAGKGATGKSLPDKKKKLTEQSPVYTKRPVPKYRPAILLDKDRIHPDEAGKVKTQKIPNPDILSPTDRQPVPRLSTSPLKFDHAAAGNLNDILDRGKPLPLTSAPGTTGSGQIARPVDRISSTLPAAGELSRFRQPMAPATSLPAPGTQAARTSGPAVQTAEPELTGFFKKGFVPPDASGPTGHLQQAGKDLSVDKLIKPLSVKSKIINFQPPTQTAPPPPASPPAAATPASPPRVASTDRELVRNTQKADDESKPKKKFSDIRGSFAGQPEWAQKAFSPDTGA